MNTKNFLISACLIIYTLSLQSQNRGVSISDKEDQTPHASAILELISDDKGFLLPRMETDDRNSISDPSESLMIFNTETKCIETYIDGVWHDFWCLDDEEPTEPLGCEGYEDGSGGFEIEYQGHTYELVEIGEQCWFAENLRVDELSDGTPIPFIGAEGEDPNWDDWDDQTSPARTTYYDGASYNDTYGYLYNNYAAIETTLCPDGWSVPSNDQWRILGGFVDTQYDYGDSEWNNVAEIGEDAGHRLKSTSGWHDGGNGTDNYDFNAKPGGARWNNGEYREFNEGAFFWTNSGNPTNEYHWGMKYDLNGIWRGGTLVSRGFSIRCLRDNE